MFDMFVREPGNWVESRENKGTEREVPGPGLCVAWNVYNKLIKLKNATCMLKRKQSIINDRGSHKLDIAEFGLCICIALGVSYVKRVCKQNK